MTKSSEKLQGVRAEKCTFHRARNVGPKKETRELPSTHFLYGRENEAGRWNVAKRNEQILKGPSGSKGGKPTPGGKCAKNHQSYPLSIEKETTEMKM